MKRLFVFISVFLIAMAVNAQSAEVVTEILESSKITYGQACYLSAVAQKLVYEEASYEDAIAALSANGQIPSNIYDANEEIQLVNLAFVYTQIFTVKGGLMYKLTKGSPRYALKLLKSDGIVPQNYDPSKVLSGREALSLYTSCLLQYGEDQFKEPL